MPESVLIHNQADFVERFGSLANVLRPGAMTPVDGDPRDFIQYIAFDVDPFIDWNEHFHELTWEWPNA